MDAARQSIDAAVAWLTDPALFEGLLKAARRGCRVRLALLDDAINRQSGLNLERLRAAGGAVFWIPEAQGGQGSLHHKFCVIDGDGVMTGSYNWTRRASRADENMIRVRGDAALAAGYAEAFAQLLDKYQLQPREPALDRQQLLRRLEVIHNLLLLDDYELLTAQLPRLEAARSLPAIAELLEQLQRQDWAAAQTGVAALLARGLALMPYEDPEGAALRLELRTLGSAGGGAESGTSRAGTTDSGVCPPPARDAGRSAGGIATLAASSTGSGKPCGATATDDDREAHTQAREDYADYQQQPGRRWSECPKRPGLIPTSRRNSSACSGRPVCSVIQIG